MSRFWHNHPELYGEIIVKEMVRRGLAREDEEPENILARWEARPDMHEIAEAAEADYWAGRIDDAMEAARAREMEHSPSPIRCGKIRR